MTLTLPQMHDATPEEMWAANRLDEWNRPTSGTCHGYVQANLAILPQVDALDFFRFCQRNPKPCPILEVTDAGNPEPKLVAPGADLRTDLPRYKVYRHGVLEEERTDIVDLWRDDFVAFLMGCCFPFEHLLLDAGLPVRNVDQEINGPVYVSNVDCVPAGSFHGKLVVSMRPMPPSLVGSAAAITEAHPEVHGGPVHIGSPELLGISDLEKPDWGDVVQMEPGDVVEMEPGDVVEMDPGDVPMFWACGVTPQQAAMETGIDLMISHATGHMFISKLRA